MKLLFHIPGDFSAGIDSDVRGEGRWSLNVAQLFAADGHDVVCCGAPGTGNVPGCEVVPLGDPLMYEEYDVFADSTYWPTRAEEIDAKVLVAMYWGWDDIAASIRTKYGRDHFVGLATMQQYRRIPDEAKTFAKLFPCPIAKEFSKYSNANASNLFQSWKWAFEDPFSNRRSIVSHKLMHIALDLAEEYGLDYHIFHADHVFGGTPGVKAHMKPDLAERLNNSDRVFRHAHAPWTEAQSILASSRLMISNFEPPISPMPVEAVAYGTIPTQEKTNIFEIDGPYIFDYVADEDYLANYLKERLRELCDQPETYNGILSDLRQKATLYTHAEAYASCLAALEEMLYDN